MGWVRVRDGMGWGRIRMAFTPIRPAHDAVTDAHTCGSCVRLPRPEVHTYAMREELIDK